MSFRDTVSIYRDARTAGDELPTMVLQFEKIPCTLKQISGDETWRGRQLNEHIDYVVQFWHSGTMNSIAPTDQVQVTGGWLAGRTLNIKFVRFIDQTDGKPPMLELMCREGNV